MIICKRCRFNYIIFLHFWNRKKIVKWFAFLHFPIQGENGWTHCLSNKYFWLILRGSVRYQAYSYHIGLTHFKYGRNSCKERYPLGYAQRMWKQTRSGGNFDRSNTNLNRSNCAVSFALSCSASHSNSFHSCKLRVLNNLFPSWHERHRCEWPYEYHDTQLELSTY